MLTKYEKTRIKEVLKEVGVNPDINFAYFLSSIDETKLDVDAMKTQMNLIINNQQALDQKLDRIINLICGK